MYGPWQGNPPYVHHDAWWGFFHLLPIVLFLVAIGVAVWAVLRFSSRPVLSGGAAAAVAAPPRDAAVAPPARDLAVEELRIRYARGELGRDDFAQRMRDLGSHDIGPTQPSPTPNDAPAPGDAAAGDG
jgi:putative membrane protein